MNHAHKLLAVLIICTFVLASCDAQVTGSSSSSSSSASQVIYKNITDLQATADLAKTAFISGGKQLVVDDGSGKKAVYSTDTFSLDGTQWSPDGRYVSFYRVGANYLHELFIYDTATGKVTESGKQVYGDQGDYQARDIWDCGSGKAIFYDNAGGGYYDVKEGKAVDIAEGEKGFHTASFSPDGSRVLYCEADSKLGAYVLKTYDVASGTAGKVHQYESFNPLTGTPPVWLSDTQVLVFEQMRTKPYLVDVSTGKKKEYPIDCTVSLSLCLSPDRNYLAYRTKGGVTVKDVTTGVEIEINMQDGSQGDPVWSYDSKKVIVSYYDAIRVFGLDGVQIGDTVKLDRYGPSNGQHVSDPVFTKDGLWYEGKE